jgi:ferredoxin-2, mitochondrial
MMHTLARRMRAVVASASPAPTPSRVRHLVRHFLATPSRGHGHDHVEDDAAEVRVTFVLKDKTERVIVGLEGQNLLRLAQQHDIELEGACEGVCACSTCHLILEDDAYDEVEDLAPLTEDEEDMLDLAFQLTPTSRLGCQIVLTPAMEGLKVELPAATRNFYVDGHVPQPH